VYLSSTVAVFAFVLLNLRVPGMPLLAVGALSNLVAILANGGAMPVDPAAAAALGHVSGAAFNNTFATDHAVLRPLTDIFALPRWLPAANVVSIGDLLISIGMAWTVVAAFGRGAPLGGDPGQRPGVPPSGPAVRGGTSPERPIGKYAGRIEPPSSGGQDCDSVDQTRSVPIRCWRAGTAVEGHSADKKENGREDLRKGSGVPGVLRPARVGERGPGPRRRPALVLVRRAGRC
jgi:hypothetical protein